MSWGMVAVAGAGLVGGILAGQSEEDSQEANAKNSKEMEQLRTQREIWLAQQQRKWELEDQGRSRAQKSADIGVFNQFQADPANYKPSANLAQQASDNFKGPTWDPTQLGSFSGTLGQFDSPSAPVERTHGTRRLA